MGELSLAELAKALASRMRPLCPKCTRHRQDPLSDEGWCTDCTSTRRRVLEQKRRAWERAQERRKKEADAAQAEA